ncbi:MAG: hypothetical protein ABIQ99_11450 [Thermoflexales bacterium]
MAIDPLAWPAPKPNRAVIDWLHDSDPSIRWQVMRDLTEARRRGEEYLLARRLLRRRSTGEVIEHDRNGDTTWTHFAFPNWWHYDVLRGLEYLRSAGVRQTGEM